MNGLKFDEFCKTYRITEQDILDSWSNNQRVLENDLAKLVAVNLYCIISFHCKGLVLRQNGMQSSSIMNDSYQVILLKIKEWKKKGLVYQYDNSLEKGIEFILPDIAPWFRIIT